mgnify:FL=1
MTTNKPVIEIRYGKIRASIWANTTQNGLRHTVTLSRLYTANGEMKSTDSLWRDDIPLAIKALDEAHTWMYSQHTAPASETEVKED